jgi:hypothetical protein
MNRRRIIARTAVLLAAVWLAVWAVRALAGTRRATAERIAQAIEEADMADWSGYTEPPDPAQADRRAGQMREIAELLNRLDFHERERMRDQQVGEDFFRRLSRSEKTTFVELTVTESMNRMMEALDAMPAEERKRFVEQGLDEVASGRTEEEMERARELGDDLLAKVTEEGMRAYYEKASTDTKLDLAPLMEAMNEVMQGLRGGDFGPSQ